MSGFFSSQELVRCTPTGCGHTCFLNKHGEPQAEVQGSGKSGIMLVVASPWSGFFQAQTAAWCQIKFAIGCSIDACWLVPAVRCRINPDRSPTKTEIDACRPALIRLIKEVKPRLVILFGQAATSAIVGYTNPKLMYGKNKGFALLRGKLFPDREFPGVWFGSTFSAAQVDKQSFDRAIRNVWKADLSQFVADSKQPPPDLGPSSRDAACCRIMDSPADVSALLDTVLRSKPLIAFDYETTGLKSQVKGHRVVSIGFAVSKTKAFAFRFPDRLEGTAWEDVANKWRKIMEDSNVRKVAHNLPFETAWTRTQYGVIPDGWVGDTQVLAHLEDSRPGHGGLKAQCYLKFGTPEYTESVDTFKSAPSAARDDAGANALNRMGQAPSRALLLYNALDALYTFWLFDWYRERGLAGV